jgi:Co/Zn/Cd efflux system component
MYGYMALLANALHMASHTTALGLSLVAYIVARRLARDSRFSFGFGKINTLAGFANAIMLLGFAAAMVTESVGRLINPVEIVFDSALLVAVIGLLDYQASPEVLQRVKEAIEASPGERITDLHVWMVSPGVHAAEIVLVTDDTKPPGVYKARLPRDCAIAHATVEVHQGKA